MRAEDASAVRELLAEATEADRRALAKALKPLLEGPKWELPEPIVFTSIDDGLAFMHSQMAAKMRGEEPEPSASERERQEWGQLSRTPAFAALAVGVAGGRAAAGRALDECRGRAYRVSDAECAAIAGVLADRNPLWLAQLVDTRLGGEGWHPGVGSWPLARWLVRLGLEAIAARNDRTARSLPREPSPRRMPGKGGSSATEDVQHCSQVVGQPRIPVSAHIADGRQPARHRKRPWQAASSQPTVAAPARGRGAGVRYRPAVPARAIP